MNDIVIDELSCPLKGSSLVKIYMMYQHKKPSWITYESNYNVIGLWHNPSTIHYMDYMLDQGWGIEFKISEFNSSHLKEVGN